MITPQQHRGYICALLLICSSGFANAGGPFVGVSVIVAICALFVLGPAKVTKETEDDQ